MLAIRASRDKEAPERRVLLEDYDSVMKRLLSAAALLAFLLGVALVYRPIKACGEWQERYKRVRYTEIIKNSPIIYTPGEIEEIIGERPSGCDIPRRLSDVDLSRYRREGVGPNEFLEERRTAKSTE